MGLIREDLAFTEFLAIQQRLRELLPFGQMNRLFSEGSPCSRTTRAERRFVRNRNHPRRADP